MSFGDVVGLAALLATIIAVFGIAGEMYKRRLAFLERKLEITAGQTAEKAAQYATHNSDIENRLRVLERIVTDGGDTRDIALQIEALRSAEAVKVTQQ